MFQTTPRARSPLLFILALLCAFLFGLVAMVQMTRAASPTTIVSFTKTADQISPDTTVFTIRVENSSPLVATEDENGSDTLEVRQTPNLLVRDFLPVSGAWYVLSAAMYEEPGGDGVVLNCDDDGATISCSVPPLLGRHLNEAGDEFVNGYAEIKIYGVLSSCGSVTNNAVLLGLPDPRTASAIGGLVCPTPIPTATATAVPPTPTSIPPTSTPTAVVTKAPPTEAPFPTITRTAPLPPNTGDSLPSADRGDSSWLLAGLGFAAIAFALSGVFVARRSR